MPTLPLLPSDKPANAGLQVSRAVRLGPEGALTRPTTPTTSANYVTIAASVLENLLLRWRTEARYPRRSNSNGYLWEVEGADRFGR